MTEPGGIFAVMILPLIWVYALSALVGFINLSCLLISTSNLPLLPLTKSLDQSHTILISSHGEVSRFDSNAHFRFKGVCNGTAQTSMDSHRYESSINVFAVWQAKGDIAGAHGDVDAKLCNHLLDRLQCDQSRRV